VGAVRPAVRQADPITDAAQVPEIFVKEAKNAATPGFDEKSITPIVKSASFLSSVNLARMPKLKGRTATVLKDGALELMATDEEDPLLAFWPIGLGRTIRCHHPLVAASEQVSVTTP